LFDRLAKFVPFAPCQSRPGKRKLRVGPWHRRLGYEDQAQLLDRTLQEEGMTDKKLTSFAESYIHEGAKTAG
jgi:hypothetical protein